MKGEGIKKFVNSKSKAFLALCFCFITGVSIFSVFDWEKYWLFRLYILLLALIFLLILFWYDWRARCALLMIIFIILGGVRYLSATPMITEKQIAYYNGNKWEFVGQVAQEPDIGIAGAKYVVGNISGKKGRVLINAPLHPQYRFGDVLRIKCDLQAPKNSDDSRFNYVKYLAKDGIYSICYRPSITGCHSLEKGNPVATSQASSEWCLDPRFRGDDNWWGTPLKLIFSLKSKINTQVEKLWPEPESSLMAGLLYGARAGLSQELKDDFSRVGITHIIAISGYNISIIASVLMTALITIGLYRPQAFWACVAGIILFVIFTGASASVIRAGIMGIIVLIAQQMGRLSKMGNVLALTAAVMLLMNPYILIWDAGFQLSFLATMGLVYLSPVLKSVILSTFAPLSINSAKNLSNRCECDQILRSAQVDNVIYSAIVETFISTLSAIIITLPLILFQFGRLSIVAPVVNVLVLWIIPWLMLFGFISVLLSLVLFPLGQVVAWIAGIGLKYVIILTQWFAGWSLAAVDMRVGIATMAISYAGIIFLIYESQNKNSRVNAWLRSRGR
ncbi:MAG: ComEC/Rec2 family competence protein [Candidatus Magasanikbacteria bacterium]